MLLLLLLMALLVQKPSASALLFKSWNEDSWLAELNTERKYVANELMMSTCDVMESPAITMHGIEVCLYLPDICST
jgi:hypothetical protein